MQILRKCYRARNVTLLGAVDIDPAKVGRDLGTLIEAQPLGIAVRSHLEEIPPQECTAASKIAIHATGSQLPRVWPQIRALLAHGFSVVSTCEELSYPWHRYPDLAAEIDAYARERKLAVLGTGVNPGFVMDTLVLALTAVTDAVSAIQVRRQVDVSKRRLPLQQKVGVGMDEAKFRQLAADGKIGHVGLEESVRLIAYGLGHTLTDVANTIAPIVPPSESSVSGLHQTSVGKTTGGIDINLDLTMALGVEQFDEIVVTGDSTERLLVPEGIFGDTATAAIAVNSAKMLAQSTETGLLTMADAGLPRGLSPRTEQAL
ncbi:hypothetical protein [Numidum massiliense]|uniref:hypothetical protein n=1 Tax=Numidum massiliense TaxID=1522315 RepID=UPI0011C8F3D1|nr:hypothetical protein [Numidum massiliense]